MKTFSVPIIIERFETLKVEAPTLDEALSIVEESTNKDLNKSHLSSYTIPSSAHVEIDWDLVDTVNDDKLSWGISHRKEERDFYMPTSDNELYGDVDAYTKGPLHRDE